jgi:hypothetical protein
MLPRRLLRWLGRRAPTPIDLRAIPLPPRELDNGYERVIFHPDGTRSHLPSRVTRVVPESFGGLGPQDRPQREPRRLFEPRGRHADGTAGRTP